MKHKLRRDSKDGRCGEAIEGKPVVLGQREKGPRGEAQRSEMRRKG